MKVLGIEDLRLKLLRRFIRNNISVNQTFTNASSAEISNQGRELAGDDPYLIRCGPYEELVISQPDQVHDFYQGDYKRCSQRVVYSHNVLGHGKPQNFNFGELFGR
ncbi:hypothetical protein D6C92_09373 [Aureobasidium pullulans]|nr:hypothetical protein D6C92_09373 [Aureobasidium pullulans]